jgi:cob(I)alamin adenosyltransferase
MIFWIGADVSTPLSSSLDRARRIAAEDTKNLEGKIDALEESLSELREFIVPGGTSSAATLHLARAIVRRAERVFFRAVEEGEELNEALGPFLNRLSSYLFVLARFANAIGGYREEHPRYSAP